MLKWNESEENGKKKYVCVKDDIVAEIETGYVDEHGDQIVNLNISRERTYGYGVSHGITIYPYNSSTLATFHLPDITTGSAILTTWYNKLFKTVEEAKAKAEEILPLFELE